MGGKKEDGKRSKNLTDAQKLLVTIYMYIHRIDRANRIGLSPFLVIMVINYSVNIDGTLVTIYRRLLGTSYIL